MTETDVKTILSGNIRQLRTIKGLSQMELAEKCELSIPYLSALERGEKFPSAGSLAALAEALDVPIAELFMNSYQMNKDYKLVLKEYFESQKESLEKICELLK